MLALRKSAPAAGVTLARVARPEPGPGEVLIEVRAAGICGSDLHVDDWTPSYHFIGPSLPVTLGHEFAGRVIALGDGVTAPALGRDVVVMPSVTCGACSRCLAGEMEKCLARKGLGMTLDGGFARLAKVPARNCVPVPEGLDPCLAALTEPLTVAHRAVERGEVRPGARVLVLGPGSIGQGIALMARRAGAAHIVVGGMRDAARLETVRRLGFEDVVDLAACDEADFVRRFGSRFDAVLEATGSAQAVRFGLARLRPGGLFVVTGIHDAPVSIMATPLVRGEMEIRGSYRAPLATWPLVLSAIAQNPEAYSPMITHRLPLSQAHEAFSLAHRREASKVSLVPER